MLFEIEGLTKTYGSRTVLDLPRLNLEKGKVYSLLGPNGAGKTTLLEMLAFLLAPTKGRIIYDGCEARFGNNDLRRLRLEVVMVPQTPILFTATVRKNVEFGLKVRKVPKREREKLVDEALEMVGMGGFAQAQANRLSGGETQRVAIARALACSPRVILFDEPTANVDVENQLIIEKIIRDINRGKGISIILTTHNFGQSANLADEEIFLFNGRTVSSVYENIFSGRVETDGDHAVFRVAEVSLPIDSAVAGKAKAAVDSRLLRILPAEEAGQVPGREFMTGRVIQVSEEGRNFRVIVHVGVKLTVLMDREAAEINPPLVGSTVTLHCPPSSVSLI